MNIRKVLAFTLIDNGAKFTRTEAGLDNAYTVIDDFKTEFVYRQAKDYLELCTEIENLKNSVNKNNN